MNYWITVVVTVLIAIKHSQQSPGMDKLINELYKNYNRYSLPAKSNNQSVEVSMSMALQQIIDFDESREELTINTWLNFEWIDYRLAWNASDYGGVRSIRLPTSILWIPDVILYNSAAQDVDLAATEVVVYSSGTCTWIPPKIVTSKCKVDVEYFPFDSQVCILKYGSWTYDGAKLNLTSKYSSEEIDLSTYSPSQEWDLLDTRVKRSVTKYECCPEPYITINYRIHMNRRAKFFVFNLLVPNVLISLVMLFSFLLPAECHEKITLVLVTLILLSVYFMYMGQLVPPNAMSIPLIAKYLYSLIVLCVLSLLMTVFILNLHYRPKGVKMPAFIRSIFCGFLARLMCNMKPPQAGKGEGSDDEKENQMNEWRFAARVLDRFCFCIFLLYWIITTIYVFNVSPHN